MNNMKIYVATHKEFRIPKSKIYVPITAGAYKNDLSLYLKDNTGDHISYKNPYYSELTALYWIWKQDKSDIVGLMHYHRYLFDKHFITRNEILQILSKYDVILPTPFLFEVTVYNQYKASHYENDLRLACNEIIRRDFKFRDFIDKVLNQNYLYIGNIFITSKEILDDYLSFLFPILFSLENQIPYFTYSSYQQRVFGFLAERIFNIYIAKQGLSIKEYGLIDTKENVLARRFYRKK